MDTRIKEVAQYILELIESGAASLTNGVGGGFAAVAMNDGCLVMSSTIGNPDVESFQNVSEGAYLALSMASTEYKGPLAGAKVTGPFGSVLRGGSLTLAINGFGRDHNRALALAAMQAAGEVSKSTVASLTQKG